MQRERPWIHYHDGPSTIETLLYHPDRTQNDPLLGIDSFAPEFWRLVAEPASNIQLMQKEAATGGAARATEAAASAPTASAPAAGVPMEEISIVSKHPITDDEITNILVGETVSLSGPGVGEMRKQMAQTIMNADEAFGTKRDKFAKTAGTVLDRTLSPAEEKIRQSIHQDVLEARMRYERGEDPTNRATQFMKRED